MGQQQLLLLVLSTVIVGLATVAGIQAFSENQAQASQDALVQRGVSIASDIQGLAERPPQMGGIDLSSTGTGGPTIADALGYNYSTASNPSGAKVDAQGAGNNGTCVIEDQSSTGEVEITCTSSNAQKDVTVTVTPGNANTSSDVIETSFN